MNLENLKRIKKLLIGFAEYYGEAMNEERLRVSATVLQDLDANEVEAAMRDLMKDPSVTRFPLPAVIRDRIRPTLSIEQAAQELVTRTMQAVGAFGYYQPERAAEWLGETAWRAIGGTPGWQDWCLTTSPQIDRAHLRERVKSLLAQQNPSGRVQLLPPGQSQKFKLPPAEEKPREALPQHTRAALDDLFAKLDAIPRKQPEPEDA